MTERSDQPGRANERLIVLLVGAVGTGKGTQAKALSRELGLPHLASGNLFRAAMAAGTPIGEEAQQYMQRGELVPDEITIGMFMEELAKPHAARGAILDGFPRTVGQAEALSRFASIDVAVDLDVPEEIVLERISSRRVCSSCGRIYSTEQPPTVDWTCDTCGGDVVQRGDDTPEAVAERLAAYATETKPTIDWYAAAGLLVRIDGLGSLDEVSERLVRAIDSRLGS